MRIAGVRLDDGRTVWLDARDLTVVALDRATAQLDGSEWEGEVFVAPEQMVSPPDGVDGLLTQSQPPSLSEDTCGHLPGSEFPTLGQTVQGEGIAGTVVALDPAERRVTIAHSGGAETVLSLGDLAGD
jgi:hypothetical protein